MVSKRPKEALQGLARSAARSQWRSQREAVAPKTRSRAGLLTRAVLRWLWNYLKVVTLPRQRFREYRAPASERPGVYRMPDRCVVALASDWGTGTDSAYRVRDTILAESPDITIHLGDVYYSGTRREFEDFFLGPEDWPRGSLSGSGPGAAAGTYALNANHEMYSGGAGYFGLALDRFGQETSYFALESEHFRVVALDTGYYAKSVPFLELILNFIRLHRANRAWLREVVFADPRDRRPVILLSHHQWFSAFDSEYRRVGRQLEPYLDRVLLWYWGHEHRFAGYAPFGFGASPVRARCIGHGGMPIELGAKRKRDDRPIVFSDDREADVVDGVPVGFCGFALLRFDGPHLAVDYYDERHEKLLTESWSVGPDGARGAVELHTELTTYGRPLEALVA